MKKFLFSVLTLAFTVAILSVSVLASPSVTYDIQKGDFEGTYKIVATVSDEDGDFRGFANTVTFDNRVIVPVSRALGAPINLVGGGSNSKSPLTTYSYYDEVEETYYSPMYVENPIWKVNKNKTELSAKTLLMKPDNCPADNKEVFSMLFVYADGKDESDFKSSTFDISQVIYSNGEGYYYGCENDGYETNLEIIDNTHLTANVEDNNEVAIVYDIQKGDIEGTYKLVATLSDTSSSFKGFANYITMDANIVWPASKTTGEPLSFYVSDGVSVAGISNLPNSEQHYSFSKEPIDIYFNSESGTPNYIEDPKWENEKSDITLSLETMFIQDYDNRPTNGEVVFSMHFVCQDNKTLTDITRSTFKIDKVIYANGEGYYYGCEDDGYTTNLKVVNNAYLASDFDIESEVAVPVEDGDVVYVYSDDSLEIVERISESGEYHIHVNPAFKQTVVVNSGYTAQKVYVINKKGYAVEVECLENTVLGQNGASIRVEGAYGARFLSYVTSPVRYLEVENDGYEIKEYGFVVTAETSATGLVGKDYVLDIGLAAAGKAKTGVAYSSRKGVDKIFRYDDDKIYFTGMLLNVPGNKASLTANIVCRPYCIVTDGLVDVTLYGEPTVRSIAGLAQRIKDANGSDYISNAEYIDKILAIAYGD